MCNLIRKIRKKSVTGYKVCMLYKGNYYSFFSAYKLKVGVIGKHVVRDLSNAHAHVKTKYNDGRQLYNKFHVKKVSMFKELEYAKRLYNHAKTCSILNTVTIVILEITVTGKIFEGDSKGMGIGDNGISYAGSEIVSFKQIEV